MNYRDIHEIIRKPERYEAHTKKHTQGQVRETLEEHTRLCQKYFVKLLVEKDLESVMRRFEAEYFVGLKEDARALFREMWHNVIIFHDVGKINPYYQCDRLGNCNVQENKKYLVAGSKHSGISSVLYIDFYLKKIKVLKEKEDIAVLKIFLFLNAYVISRHHSDLNGFEDYLKNLESGDAQKIVKLFAENKIEEYLPEFSLNPAVLGKMGKNVLKRLENQTKKQCIWLYGYSKLMYSLLVTSDYYATAEFEENVEIKSFGNITELKSLQDIFQHTKINQSIDRYRAAKYPQSSAALSHEKDINVLRSELYLEAEENLLQNLDKNIYYLEAPTGSGKSNISINLSFQLAGKTENLRKIFYIYPFNTLIEQNLDSLYRIFDEKEEIKEQIKVVNSITPIGTIRSEKKKEEETESGNYYQKLLLDRQFLNYPIVLTTHVSIFDTLFGNSKESVFGFHQFANSIIVLDEIQSYKNIIWNEIISFLKMLSVLLNIKVIIMSATLPNLDLFMEDSIGSCELIRNRDKYFHHPLFQKRVVCDYELLEVDMNLTSLKAHVQTQLGENRKILVEFIKKRSADDFYQMAMECWKDTEKILYMTGDDSSIERKKILNLVKDEPGGVLLIATQVVEAGVDIDMDIGYKNIAKLDSEEQFMGRVNRSSRPNQFGKVYFFRLDDAKSVYGEDVRLNKELTLANNEMKNILSSKNFTDYYKKVIQILQKNYEDLPNAVGVKQFFEKVVGKLAFPDIKKRMQLIDEDNWSMNVFLNRTVIDESGNEIHGSIVWSEYKMLLIDIEMNYAEKRVKLSHVLSQADYFIYQIKKNPDLIVDDYIGELLYIDNGEKYFENGKLNRKKIQGEIGTFVDFI